MGGWSCCLLPHPRWPAPTRATCWPGLSWGCLRKGWRRSTRQWRARICTVWRARGSKKEVGLAGAVAERFAAAPAQGADSGEQESSGSLNGHGENQISEWLRAGIAAAKANRRDEARELLLRVVEADEEIEQAWLWLSGVVDSDEDRLIALENVLEINPDNAQARAGVKWLRARVGEREVEEPVDAPAGLTGGESVSQPQERAALELDQDGCAYCARPVSETDVRCPHCGGRLVTKHFKNEERSPLGYLLHAYWLILMGINLADYFLIGFLWRNDGIP